MAKTLIKNIRQDKTVITVEMICENQSGEIFIKGEAVLKVFD